MPRRPRRRQSGRPTSRSTRSAGRSRQRRGRWPWRWVLLWGAVLALVIGALYTLYLDHQVRRQFEGKRWSLPARVFARPLELHAGRVLDRAHLQRELEMLHYRSGPAAEAGEFRVEPHRVVIATRGFPFPDDPEPPRHVAVEFADGQVSAVRDLDRNRALSLFRLDPVAIANIYPANNEDRLLVRRDQVPAALIGMLLAVEDRKFYDHHGVDPLAIGRALLANLRAGRTVQGGSTLTQQLVKNFYLTQDRTFRRKANEAIMALLLEYHYDKDEILEAYLNEVFLGQDGRRAIHGFGLAAQFYFQRRLQDLDTHELALLVAMVRGPSYYDPRRREERALDRRNRVLDLAEAQGVIDAAEATRARKRPLGVTSRAPSGVTPFPAFLQLVREQLYRDYQEDDLRNEGLVIFTTLDPLVQVAAERAVTDRLAAIERARNLPAGELDAAVVVTSPEQGEVLAMIGGRDLRYAGFNRALAAARPIGSLVKPIVYLTALQRLPGHTLATPLDDGPLEVKLDTGQVWAPNNYDRQFHGQVMTLDALVHSYNVSTARLGLGVGVGRVVDQMLQMGLPRRVPAYPSLLLGAVELSPYQVAQLYQGLAAGGYGAPLRAIREVMDSHGQVLSRYPLDIARVADPTSVYLVTAALHDVTRRGTASALQTTLPGIAVAGKTGTTDDLRDAWFAGYSADHLAVVWVGRDDNRPIGLTGSSGALPIWGSLMSDIPTRTLAPPIPDNVEWLRIDTASGLRADAGCTDVRWIPFVRGSAPTQSAPCASESQQTDPIGRGLRWFQDLFEQR